MTQPECSPIRERISWRHYSGIFLLSLATLVLELALTRVLSVALWYHFGFLVISTVLLGFGTSGVVLALWQGLRERAVLDRTLALLALLFGVLTVGGFWLMQRIPFDPFSLFADRQQLLFMPLYYVILALPYFCAGLALALLFTRGVAQINRLYACDLVGAGVGCAIIALIMPMFGGSGAIIIAAVLGLLAAVVFGLRWARGLALTGAVLGVTMFGVACVAERALPISVTPNKTHPPGPTLYTAWNTFSRIDVYEQLFRPGTGGRGGRQLIFDAGTAATGIVDLRPDVRTALRQLADTRAFESSVAYIGKSHPRVLIIGAAGGEEVLDALHYGAAAITAVEINPIITDVVTRRMRDFWGGLFEQPEVRLVTAEGRSFVRRSREQYDAIISVHTISNAAIASGALALAENYVLTREAFTDYLDLLTPDGVLYFVRPEAQIARLVATGRESLAARGITDPAGHFYLYRHPYSTPRGQLGATNRPSFRAGFLMKKSSFTPQEVRLIQAHLGISHPSGRTLEPLYSPLEPHEGSIYHTLLTTPDPRTVYAAQTAQLVPTTDDRPFFNQHTRWSSINFATIRDLFTQERLGRLALEDRPVVEVTLLVLLVQAVLIATALIVLPLARFARAGLHAPNRGRFLLYFASLGLGFIMIEMALLQRFTLFLGQPVYTFAVVLASLLVFTGVGASLAGRLCTRPRQNLRWILLLILVTLVGTAFLTPVVLSAALALPLVWRILVALLLIAPLGVLLGLSFPTGLRVVANEAPVLVPWAWGVNGFCTVIGTTVALILGMACGFTAVLMIAGLCYAIALAAMLRRETLLPVE
jgi:Spermine/spermidine synthase domain